MAEAPRLNLDKVSKELGRLVSFELLHWQLRLEFETIRALAIECMPWYSSISLSLLTEREKDAGEISDWDTAAWRLFQFPSSPGHVWPLASELLIQINNEWETLSASDNAGATTNAAREFTENLVRACVTALKSKEVQGALRKYQLSADFRLMARHTCRRPRR